MKKLYSCLLIGLLAIVAPALANAYSVTVKVEDPEHLSATLNSEPYALTAGDNVIEYDYSATLSISTTDENYVVKSFYNLTENYQMNSFVSAVNTSFYSWSDGNEYSISAINLTEARSGNFTVKVDDPSLIDARLAGTYTKLEMTPGENAIKFIPDVETYLTISPTNYNQPLYQVLKNGEPVPAQYGSYQVYLEEGVEIDIQAVFPDLPATVSFNYLNDCRGIITAVNVNGSPVTDYTDGFTARLGDQVELYIDQSLYKFNSIQLNDGNKETYIWGSYQATLLKEENVITIDAQRHATYDITVNLTNPDQVELYRGQSYNGVQLTDLAAGENTVQMTTANTTLTVKAAAGCFITSVTANGEPVSVNYANQYEVQTTEGMTIDIVSGEVVRDQTLILYIDDVTKAPYGYDMYRSDTDHSRIQVTSGYNTVKFCAADLPLRISFYQPELAKAYLNNEPYDPEYENGTSYQISDIEDGDIFKVYMVAEPSTHNISFYISEGVTLKSITHDRVNPFDHNSVLSVLTGTEINIEPDQNTGDLQATLDDDLLEATDGIYTFNASADHQFQLIYTPAGIENVITGTVNDSDVYNLQGIRVATNGATDHLPAGIYIKGGRKVIVR